MEEVDLLAEIVQDYYINQLSLGQLAEKYQLSRYLVNKYLEDARDQGIVTISIALPVQRNQQLEQKFHELFDINEIFIIKDSGTSNARENLIKFASEYIQKLIAKSSIVGTVWGRTMYDVVEKFKATPLDGLTFTQFMGENRKYKSAVGSRRMVEDVAIKFSANYITLSGPLYITNPETRLGMRKEIASEEAFEAAENMDMLFAGLGTFASVLSIPTWRNHTAEIFPNLNPERVAGLIYGRPFDINGNILNRNEDCVFGIDLEHILAVPHRVGVVPSKFKSEATLGALRGKFFTDLIISENIALRILSEI